MRYQQIDNAILEIMPDGLVVKVDQKRITLEYLESIIKEKTDITDDSYYGNDGDWQTDGYRCYYNNRLVESSFNLSAIIDAFNLIKFGVVLRPDKTDE